MVWVVAEFRTPQVGLIFRPQIGSLSVTADTLMAMSVLRPVHTATRLLEKEPAWKMLRTRNAPVSIAILDAQLGGETRRLPAPVLFEKVEENLEELRDNGFDLPQTAQAYCTEWRNEGILIRRISEVAREETFELSQGALQAIRFITQLSEPRAAVTESRLETILDRVRLLARDTDPDIASRLATLREEREKLDTQIARVAAGEVPLLSGEQATERINEVLGLIEEVPGDFARVRAEMEFLNRDLRERLIDVDGPRGTVLEDIFRGVDMLAQSEAGRSFSGFYALLLDPERGLDFEEGIGSILDRDFVASLPPSQLRLMRRILPMLQDRSSEIHAVMTAFSRSLRRFVQSQEFQTDKLINKNLRIALRQGMDTSRVVKPYAKTGLMLDLTGMQMTSVSTLKPHNPADFTVEGTVESHASEPVDIEELRALARASEIDMLELTENVNAVLELQSAATIGEVLTAHPATQGVASVVGLLVLAEEHAHHVPGREDVSWDPGHGTERHGSVGRYLFTERIQE